MANIILPVIYKLTSRNPKYSIDICDNPDGKIIASLTSFPARIDKLWIVIESILRQSRKPDKLILWLSKDQFKSMDDLPHNLTKLQSRGLIINFRDNDYRSHKKYIYILNEYPDSHLLTFDDDIIYPENTIEDIITKWEENPKCVVGRYSNQLTKDKNGKIKWKTTEKSEVNIPSDLVFIGSGGCALYPSNSLPTIAMNIDIAMKICQTADDVWLNTMLRFNRIQIITILEKCPLISIINFNKHNYTLASINNGEDCVNAKQLDAVRAYCIENGCDPYNSII